MAGPDRARGRGRRPPGRPTCPPTIAELCGLPAAEGLDGVSLAGLLTGGPAAGAPGALLALSALQQPGRPARRGDPRGRLEARRVVRDRPARAVRPGPRPPRVEQPGRQVTRPGPRPGRRSWRAGGRPSAPRCPRPTPDYTPNPQAADGSITLPASTAEVHGVMLRFEPLPHKNTLGYWVRPDDWASWEFEVERPGEFAVEAAGRLRGGQRRERRRVPGRRPGVDADRAGDRRLPELPEAGPRPGRDRPGRPASPGGPAISKPGAAVMDLREVKLVPSPRAG